MVIIRQLSEEENRRRVEEFREKRLRDELSALNGARREGIEEGRQQFKSELIEKMRKMGLSEERIKELLSD